MRIGFGQVTITPPLPVQLAGYGCERAGNAIADDLHARALVCEHEGRTVALLTVDLLWLERRNLRALRAMVEELCGIAPSDLMVCCSHTHSGPDTIDWFAFAPVDQQWLQTLLRQLAGAVFVAWRDLRPARIEKLVGETVIGVNRRVHKEREGFRMGANLAGPVDQTLTVLRILDEDDTLIGSVLHHATHPVVLGGKSLVISADWPGEACRLVEREVGGTCLFVNGAAGDINPRIGVGRSYAEVLRVGRQAGGAAVELLSREPGEAVDGIAAASRHIVVPHRPHPYLDIPYERRLNDDGGMCLEVQVLRLGPLTFISAPGECLSETGWRVVEQSGLASAVIAGYTNDYIGYLPLPHIYEQGGYEPSATMLPPEAVLHYVEAAAELARETVGG